MKIFLDIDGVMVHANPSKRLDFESDGFYKFNVEAINAINFLNNEDNEFILSTSHRFRYTIKEWKGIFKRRGINFKKISVVDISLDNYFSRKVEIETWIMSKKILPEDFLIIDDDKSLNGLKEEFKSRLVLTNSYVGLNSSKELERFVSNSKRTIRKRIK